MGASATGFPLLPAGYTAGTITIAAGQANVPQNLMTLIQQQLDINVQGSGYEIQLQTDNSGNVFIGNATTIGGPLSSTNYGYQLFQGGASRTYRSGFPGSHSSVQDLQVLMTAAGTFHVEIT